MANTVTLANDMRSMYKDYRRLTHENMRTYINGLLDGNKRESAYRYLSDCSTLHGTSSDGVIDDLLNDVRRDVASNMLRDMLYGNGL